MWKQAYVKVLAQRQRSSLVESEVKVGRTLWFMMRWSAALDKMAAKVGQLLSIKSGNAKAVLYRRREQMEWWNSNRTTNFDTFVPQLQQWVVQ